MDGNIVTRPIGGPPLAPRTIADTGLNRPNLLRLALKHCYLRGVETTAELAEGLGLGFGVATELFAEAKDKQLVEIRGSSGTGYSDFVFALTKAGRDWASAALSHNQYAGKAPVSLAAYREQVARQRLRGEQVTPESLAEGLEDLVLSPHLARRIGPAVNGGRSVLLYGAPGNGKTSVAARISKTFAGTVYLPHAVEVDGQIIKLYDPMVHIAAPDGTADRLSPSSAVRADEADGRWVACKRPVVLVGGELTMEALELKYSETSGLYEAPLQVKANGGVFILDDLGRQRISAKDLLNRWIVPMEQGIDYLALETGSTIAVPFDSLLIFSTNLEPARLMDPAFLRRIPYKIEMLPPSEAQYREAFARECAEAGLQMGADQIDYVLREVQTTHAQPLAFYQPRFIVEQIVAASAFEGGALEARPDLVDDALQNLSAQPD